MRQRAEEIVLDVLSTPDVPGADELRLAQATLVPEVRLLLADDPIVLWARLEAAAGRSLPAPLWASAWAGGQALARYVLDHPWVVAGRRVLDLASGSGLVAIAAAMAGASAVEANDIDPYAIAAIAANAKVNDVAVTPVVGDLLSGDGNGAQTVLVGDALYTPVLAQQVLPFLLRAADRGARVLVGDPGRGHVPTEALELVARYRIPVACAPEDAQFPDASIFAVRPR